MAEPRREYGFTGHRGFDEAAEPRIGSRIRHWRSMNIRPLFKRGGTFSIEGKAKATALKIGVGRRLGFENRS